MIDRCCFRTDYGDNKMHFKTLRGREEKVEKYCHLVTIFFFCYFAMSCFQPGINGFPQTLSLYPKVCTQLLWF